MMAAEESHTLTCGVCSEKLEEANKVQLPCCGRDEASTGCCRSCIETICSRAGGVGRCPICRGHIEIKDGTVNVATPRGQCVMCMQPNKVIVDRGLCNACLLGSRHVFTYECNRCHRRQRIPHPMWRYQPSVDGFGGATWACHQQCGDYTTWRIVLEDAANVPPEECPESWGPREEWLARLRAQQTSGQ